MPASALDVHDIHVEEGPARQRLATLATQASLTITVIPGDMDEPRTHGVSGALRADEALDRMLIGTGLTYAFLARDTVEVRSPKGRVRWYEIPRAAALDGVRKYVDTQKWEAIADQEAILRTTTAGVRGCRDADDAARALFAESQLTYEWIPDARGPGPVVNTLVVRAAGAGPLKRMLARPRMLSIEHSAQEARCWRPCDDGSQAGPPPLTCIDYVYAPP